MSSEYAVAEARAVSLRDAKLRKVPLQIWPGDAENLTVASLPDVGHEYIETHPEYVTYIRYGNERLDFEVGKRYGVVEQSFDVKRRQVVVTVGVWE